MELSPQQQIFEQLHKANKILVVLSAVLNADSIASALALRLALLQMHKEVDVAASSPLPENLKFFPGSADIKQDVDGYKSFIVTVNTAVKKLDEISYQAA